MDDELRNLLDKALTFAVAPYCSECEDEIVGTRCRCKEFDTWKRTVEKVLLDDCWYGNDEVTFKKLYFQLGSDLTNAVDELNLYRRGLKRHGVDN